MKSAFLADISHELRTSMKKIRGLWYLLPKMSKTPGRWSGSGRDDDRVRQPVGWTSDSAVHRSSRHRWWTALRLSTLGRRPPGPVSRWGRNAGPV